MKGFLSLIYLIAIVPISILGMMWGWGLEAANWGWIIFSYFFVVAIPALIALIDD